MSATANNIVVDTGIAVTHAVEFPCTEPAAFRSHFAKHTFLLWKILLHYIIRCVTDYDTIVYRHTGELRQIVLLKRLHLLCKRVLVQPVRFYRIAGFSGRPNADRRHSRHHEDSFSQSFHKMHLPILPQV